MTHRRYKIQICKNITARDRADVQFLFGEAWLTVAEADRKDSAKLRRDAELVEHPDATIRVAEEWPRGSELRPVEI